MDVVVVESPTKAKTINKYLGDAFTVLPSYGHVRDLPEKDGSVQPDDDFRMIYEVQADKKKRIDEIVRALKGADRLFLATDPDREGEAISWHLLAALTERGAVKKVDVKRVLFHEVTKNAVLEAMQKPRDLDAHLIDAYQARRALDYLVGFTLSPVLWRKLQGSRSAGRVQSVALRLVCEREAEIEAFIAREYWTVEAMLATPAGVGFKARLAKLDGKKLDKFGLPDEAAAKKAVAAIENAALAVTAIEKKQVSRNPAPPFSTSTLQQEASRKLGFSADRTMKTAQRLFEGISLDGETVGLITYMRTDSVQLSNEALTGCRRVIGERFGQRYLPDHPRQYKTKTKNAQEAHEAIRPTDLGRHPQDMRSFLDDDQRRLYELVWQRTMASQMAAALLDRVVIDMAPADDSVGLRATGQTIAFDGFLRLYQEGRDDPTGDEEEDGEGLLPAMAVADRLRQEKVLPAQHFTEPPPRFSEASLVKRLEELGIGRPSTYASILTVLQDRAYVRLEQKRFIPEDRGRLVTGFLTSFFDRYVQPEFTAALESQLDDVAAGTLGWKDVLRQFWDPFIAKIDEVKERRVSEVIDALNATLEAKLFPPRADGGDRRICPTCGVGTLSLKLGKYGAFVGCSNYPECRFTRQLDAKADDGTAAAKERLLGVDPESAEEVWLKDGRFGAYVQRGSGETAKRCSLPPGVTPGDLDLELALRLLALPREVGLDPETGKPITAGLNRYGPFVASDGRYVRLEEGDDVLAVGMNRALALLAQPVKRFARAAPGPLREVGAHPEDGQPIQLFAGRFGPYVKHGAVNASLPRGLAAETLTVDDAVRLIAERVAKGPSTGKAGAKRRPGPTAGKSGAKPVKAGAKTNGKPAAKAKPKAKAKSAARKPAGKAAGRSATTDKEA